MSFWSANRLWLQRLLAVLIAVIGAPVLIALGALTDDAPVREGEPAPRTVVADQLVRIADEEATDAARQDAADGIEAVEAYDSEAQATIVSRVRSVFDAAEDVRTGDGDQTPSPQQQRDVLAARLPELDQTAIASLVALDDGELARTESEAEAIAQQLARQRIAEDELEEVIDDQLELEMRLRNFPGDSADALVEPLLREVMQPTVVIDEEATAEARERAAEDVSEVVETWDQDETIVREGEVVDAVQLAALTQRGLDGTDPAVALLRATAAMILTVLLVSVYLRRMQPKVWRSGRKAILLATVAAGYAATVSAVALLAEFAGPGWWYAVPAGALAMLIAILVHPVVGIAMMLPASLLVLLVAPESAPVAIFAAAVVLVSVPLVTRLTSRADLRSATLRAGLVYPVIAGVVIAVFGPRDELLSALGAGALGGIMSGLLVQGLLPFLENLFRLPTVTALLDLADRNHPLLRELETKALGSYNHSVMVASLVERGCREIGANGLLGSVAALYHDIGKVRQPHFFIENQQGIANPHDELEPEVSAVIIQNHVADGVEMARHYHLPPEVVACIGSHHGNMIVTFFFRKALDREHGDLEHVDAEHFRYKGAKPASKEAAILLMADCCEAATRAAAMERGTLPRDEIESMVDGLIAERVDDGQFDECELTFAEMSRVRDSIVEALVGIYHPRIAYPSQPAPATSRTETNGATAETPTAAAPPVR